MSLDIGVNLIPAGRRQRAQRRRRFTWWSGAWTTYAVALALVIGFMYLRIGHHSNLSQVLARENEQFDQLRTEQKQGNQQLHKVVQTIASSQGLLHQPDWSQLLSILSDLRGDDIALSSVQLNLTPEQAAAAAPVKEEESKKSAPVAKNYKWKLDLSGFGKAPESVSLFVLRLEGTQLFDRVNLLKTNRQPFGVGEATSFSISCPLKGRGRNQP